MNEMYKNDLTGKIQLKVAVEFKAIGTLDLEFDSLEEVNEKIQNKDYIADLPLPSDWSYLEDSFYIDYEGLSETIDAFEIKGG